MTLAPPSSYAGILRAAVVGFDDARSMYNATRIPGGEIKWQAWNAGLPELRTRLETAVSLVDAAQPAVAQVDSGIAASLATRVDALRRRLAPFQRPSSYDAAIGAARTDAMVAAELLADSRQPAAPSVQPVTP